MGTRHFLKKHVYISRVGAHVRNFDPVSQLTHTRVAPSNS